MKKVCLVLVTAIFLSGCNGDSRMSENYLTKQYNIESKALDLSDSGLTKVPDFSMYPNEADIFGASEINLADNDIKELDAASFTSFKNLKKVSLADNELKVIRNLDLELDNLDLSDNELEILSFASGASVRSLDISDNELKFGGDIQDLPVGIEWMNASSNQLENVDGLGKLLRLQYLDVSNNLLSDLDMKELSPNKRLQYLDISGNPEMTPERIKTMETHNNKYKQKQSAKTGTSPASTETGDQ